MGSNSYGKLGLGDRAMTQAPIQLISTTGSAQWQAKAELLNVQKERSKAMVVQGNMAQSTYDQLEAKYQVALAELNLAKKNLSYIEMKAPFDGVISSVNRENHETVQAGQSVLVLHRVDRVEVAVDLPDYVVARAHRTSPDSPQAHAITVKLDAFPNQVFQARYLEHTAEHTSTNRTYRLILEMPLDPAKPFFQGMSGNIEVDMNKLHLQFRHHFMVPGEAIVVPDEVPLTSGKRWVWRLKSDQTVEPVAVTVGSFRGDGYEVSGALQAGDRIVLRGQSYLQAGLPVKVQSEGSQI